MIIQPVVLSGGSGTRLWPLSRENYPKQLLTLVGKDSLLQATVRRVEGLAGAQLAAAQRWIFDQILQKLPITDAAHGFVAGRSTVTNARPHVGQRIVINLDLADFFPSITFPRVRGLFSATHIGRLLGVPVLGFDLPRTFAEIEAALAN